MRGIRFFEEYHNKRKGESTNNVIAVQLNDQGQKVGYIEDKEWHWDCIAGVFFVDNSDVASDSVSESYLRAKCKRISEARAREIHPRLFTYLDYEPQPLEKAGERD
jgi:hypothetical protein